MARGKIPLCTICLAIMMLRFRCSGVEATVGHVGAPQQRRPANPRNLTVYHVVDQRFQPPVGSPEREWPVDMNTVCVFARTYLGVRAHAP